MINLKFPIIQAPMAGGVLNANLVSQVSNLGFLGSIPAGYLTITDLQQFIREVKSKTVEPFLVNIFILENTEQIANTTHRKPQVICDLEHIFHASPDSEFIVPKLPNEDEYIDLLINEGVPLVSSTFGFFSAKSVAKLKKNQVKVVGNATSISEAGYCFSNGADAVILQGTDAGGHQGTFLQNKNITQTMDLLQQVRAVFPDKNLIATGGILPAEIKQYLNASANYVQLGSAFLFTNESNFRVEAKEYVLKNPETVLTKVVTGRYARWIKNSLVGQLSKDSSTIFDYPIQSYATSGLRKMAQLAAKPEYMGILISSNAKDLKAQSLLELYSEIVASLENKD